MLSRRDAMTDADRASASTRIAERAAVELAATPAMTIALYATKGSEVDTAALDAALRTAGATVVYPRVVEGQRELQFFAVAPHELLPSRHGLREPALGGTATPLAAIHAFCIPGLAFDRAGWRIGWGHGYYDATLAAAPDARRIGVAFDCQLVDEIAHDPHDARLHLVVTESTTHRVS
jgi:5-formyltetrahydrofolate cyclo-ligase